MPQAPAVPYAGPNRRNDIKAGARRQGDMPKPEPDTRTPLTRRQHKSK